MKPINEWAEEIVDLFRWAGRPSDEKTEVVKILDRLVLTIREEDIAGVKADPGESTVYPIVSHEGGADYRIDTDYRIESLYMREARLYIVFSNGEQAYLPVDWKAVAPRNRMRNIMRANI